MKKMNLFDPKRPIIILGAGGHAKVLIDLIKSLNGHILGLVDQNADRTGMLHYGYPILGGDEVASKYDPASTDLVNAIGSSRIPEARKRIFEYWQDKGFNFPPLIHPSAQVSPSAMISSGVQVMHGVIIQAEAQIGKNCIVNTGSIVEHDVRIGAHCHIASGVTLAGGASVGENCHIGAGATLIQGVVVGSQCLVGAGAVVTKTYLNGKTLVGVPARELEL